MILGDLGGVLAGFGRILRGSWKDLAGILGGSWRWRTLGDVRGTLGKSLGTRGGT